MLHPFISTARPTRVGRAGPLALSVTAHMALLITLIAIRVTTASSGGTLAGRHPPIERIRFIEVARAPIRSDVVRTPTPAPQRRPRAEVPQLPSFAPVSIDVPTIASTPVPLPAAPDLDLTSRVTDSRDFGTTQTSAVDALGAATGAGTGAGTGLVHAAPANGIYDASMVEQTVMPFPNNPKPVYPRSLLSAGIEGQFVVTFVVDTTGRVDERSVKFPPSARRLFTDAVWRALKRSRYRPATVGGEPVAQLVEQQFTFRIER